MRILQIFVVLTFSFVVAHALEGEVDPQREERARLVRTSSDGPLPDPQ